MSSPFGIVKRKGKNSSPTGSLSLPSNILNTNGGSHEDTRKVPSKALFSLRKRLYQHGQISVIGLLLGVVSLLFVGVVLMNLLFTSSLFWVSRPTNPGWGKHPRVAKLEHDPSRERAKLRPMERLPELEGSHSVPAMAPIKFLKNLADSDSYDDKKSDEFENETCKAQYDWQKTSFPTCNHLHERELVSQMIWDLNPDDPFKMVGHGYWRDVWIVPKSKFDGPHVLKTIRYEHDYTERNYDRHRRDALAMERLSHHPFVMEIYAYCANSGLFEFAPGGDISDALWPGHHSKKPPLSKLERLHIGVQAAIGLAALHNFDQEGRPSVAHTDISPGQFVKVGDKYKLNDFNRARFLRQNVNDGSVCTYRVGNNPGKNRSPEEYAYLPQTEKIDVYSLGNIYYMLLTDMWPFHGVKEKEAIKKVKAGERPPLFSDVVDSTDASVVALRTAMYMCHEQDVKKRASSRQVETYLKERLEEIDPGRLDNWFQTS